MYNDIPDNEMPNIWKQGIISIIREKGDAEDIKIIDILRYLSLYI